uniref:ADAM metallopeptidase domain 9 n=1 Tax=Stegastes partitus TaxID=144197 RepID=A0A3B5AU62_9TELE
MDIRLNFTLLYSSETSSINHMSEQETLPPAGHRDSLQLSLFQSHCQYRGFVQDVEGSAAAMSICNGLRGVIHLADDSYGIEPSDSAPDQHLVYRLQDVTSQPRGCGTPHDHSNATERAQNGPEEIHHRQHSRIKRAVLHQTHYVELLLVVDNDRFNYMNRNETAVRDEMVHLANFVDRSPPRCSGKPETISRRLILDTVGCSNQTMSPNAHQSGEEMVPSGFTLKLAFLVVGVSGTSGLTNMDSVSSLRGSRNFSSCSADDFEKMILLTGGTCLLNVPRPDEAYSAPYCGNRLVDVGEECDCGSEKECEEDPCCEFQTCKLKPGAQCAYGECCYKCQYLPGGSVCRSSTDECDLPEYCNGSSSFCQSDVFIQNGQPCRNQQAYCYNGKCQHYDGQCQAIFGSKAKAAPEICFKNVNSKGDRFGNCGYHNYGYKKCESRNALCGKLQCSNVQTVTVFGIEPSIITTPIGGDKCFGVDFMLGSDVPDPGMVTEGTKCGEDKVCMNFECRSAEVLNYDCDVEKKCHGHGVCNSNKNCHCDGDWAPPFCELKGYGGSVDSGPTWNDKDTSLRDGLLVFFFLVLPLLALAAFVFLRRNELLRHTHTHTHIHTHTARPVCLTCVMSSGLTERLQPIPAEDRLPERSRHLLPGATPTTSSETG